MSNPYEGDSGNQNQPGILGRNTADGVGVSGESGGGRGVAGSSKTFQGVFGHSDSNAGVVGESNGLVATSEGRILLGISAPCDHCTPASKWSAAIVSFRPDGRDLRVFARGIRAPIALAYYPGTSDLLVTMNQRDDDGHGEQAVPARHARIQAAGAVRCR